MIKTRIAPSPTGELHIGTMRSLLYNYAFAKKSEGTFLLRVEDTDRERYVEGAMERMYQVIADYGLSWDEGPLVGGPNEPYLQSQRLDLYKKYALELVAQGHAYYCFCTKQRLEELRQAQQAAHLPVTKYDQACLALSADQVEANLQKKVPYVIRLKVPAERMLEYTDLVLGKVSFPSNDVEDQVLLKSDGYPTYHLAVVVDDHLMGVTHILRGREWLASTPKHLLLYDFLGWEMPKTGHLPVLKEVGATKKMSKRLGDVAAVDFLKNGYLPEALLNFLMLLGWNPGTDQELFTLAEFVKAFSLERIHKTDLVAFDREKLAWFNGHYLHALSAEGLYDRLVAWAKKWDVELVSAESDQSDIIQVIELIKDRLKVLADFNELASYFFRDPQVDPTMLSAYADQKWPAILTEFYRLYQELPESGWVSEQLETISQTVLTKTNSSAKAAFMTLRAAVTGQTATPPLFAVLEVLGKATVLRRLSAFLPPNSN
ncbi:glutamate--tRNA ligase [Patescibacteria group bacterium]|nr:glutamate--tRNA ligase [Patescibacteria group bacterium]